jgi:integrase
MPVYAYTTAAGEHRYRVLYRDPQHHQRSKRGFKRKRDAEDYEAGIRVEKRAGNWIDPTDAAVTITALSLGWFATKKATLRPSSYHPLEVSWRTHVAPIWGRAELRAVKHDAVQAWVNDLADNRSATTVLRAFSILKGICETAVLERRITASPCVNIQLPRKTPKPHAYLTHEQLWRLAAECGDRQPLVLTLGYCGIRWGEAIALTVAKVDYQRQRLAIESNVVRVAGRWEIGPTKGNENRSVPFPTFLASYLHTQTDGKPPEGLVFPGIDGGYFPRPGTGAENGSWFANAVKRARLPHLTPHDLRHTAASLAIQAGANVKAVQRMLGHKDASVTLNTYADLFDTDLDNVAQALDQAVRRTDVAKLLPK